MVRREALAGAGDTYAVWAKCIRVPLASSFSFQKYTFESCIQFVPEQAMDVCVKSKVIDAVLCSVHMKYDGGQAIIKKDWQAARD